MEIDWSQMKRLKDLALEASGSKWDNRDSTVYAVWSDDPQEETPVAKVFDENDAAYIAAAGPEKVFELIVHVLLLEWEANWLADRLASAPDLLPSSCKGGDPASLRAEWRNEARKAREKLYYPW